MNNLTFLCIFWNIWFIETFSFVLLSDFFFSIIILHFSSLFLFACCHVCHILNLYSRFCNTLLFFNFKFFIEVIIFIWDNLNFSFAVFQIISILTQTPIFYFAYFVNLIITTNTAFFCISILLRIQFKHIHSFHLYFHSSLHREFWSCS